MAVRLYPRRSLMTHSGHRRDRNPAAQQPPGVLFFPWQPREAPASETPRVGVDGGVASLSVPIVFTQASEPVERDRDPGRISCRISAR